MIFSSAQRTKSSALVALALFAAMAASAASTAAAAPRAKPLGHLDFVKGEITLTRNGDEDSSAGPGDPVFDGDRIRTSATSSVVIAMDPSSGFSGSLTVNPSSTLYLSRSMSKAQPKTSIDLMAGSISAKVTKLIGNPAFDVSTGGTVFGVRGTEFEIALSINDSLFAVCEQGMVAVTVEGADGESAVPAGTAIQSTTGRDFAKIASNAESLRGLRDKWLDGEATIFRKSPLKALASFELRYSQHSSAILEEAKALALDPVFRKWVEERRAGIVPNPLDPKVMREKKQIASQLFSLAKRIAVFERVWWRLQDAVDLVRAREMAQKEIRKGLVVSKFLEAFDRDKKELYRSLAIYHRAATLYKEHSDDSEDLMSVLAPGGKP